MRMRIGLTDRLRVRAAISRKHSRHLQPRARRWTRHEATSPRMRTTSRKSRASMLGLAEKKKRSARHAARSSSNRLPRTRSTVRQSLRTWRWFTPGRASATARSSNSKLSRPFPDMARHTAISVSIRAGMICAVISASTKSLPQPKPPADSSLELLDQSNIPESSQVIIGEARIAYGAAKFEPKLVRWVLTKYIVHTNGDCGVVQDVFPARHGVSSCGQRFLLFAHDFLLAL